MEYGWRLVPLLPGLGVIFDSQSFFELVANLEYFSKHAIRDKHAGFNRLYLFLPAVYFKSNYNIN